MLRHAPVVSGGTRQGGQDLAEQQNSSYYEIPDDNHREQMSPDGFLLGYFLGVILTPEAKRYPDKTRLALALQGDRSGGQAAADRWVEACKISISYPPGLN
jgi:hypothetical protein